MTMMHTSKQNLLILKCTSGQLQMCALCMLDIYKHADKDNKYAYMQEKCTYTYAI